MKFTKLRAKDVKVGMAVSCYLMSFPQTVELVEHTKKKRVVLWTDTYRTSLIGSVPEEQWVNVKSVDNSVLRV